MKKKHSCNIGKTDTKVRYLLATLLAIFAVYSSCYLLLVASAILFYTALTHFCFAYHIFKINERFSKKNHYLTFLPKYNPSAVFIFDKMGKLVFMNKAAKEAIPHVESPKCLSVYAFERLIEHSTIETLIFEDKGVYYKAELQGLKKRDFFLPTLQM